MKRIVCYVGLVWLVCISAAVASQQTDHRVPEDATATKDADSKVKEMQASRNVRDVPPSSDLKERGMDSDLDSLFDSDSFEDEGMKDRGLFDIFSSPGKQRRRRGMYSPGAFGGGYGRQGGGRPLYNRQPYGGSPRYGGGMGAYGSDPGYGYGGRYPPGGQYPYGRMGQYPGGGRGGRMGSPLYGEYPGAGAGYPGAGYPGAGRRPQRAGSPYYQPYYRDLPTESDSLAEPVVAR